MKKIHVVIILIVVALIVAGIGGSFVLLPVVEKQDSKEFTNKIITLPEPMHDSETSIEKALLKRRSIREYKDEPLLLTEVSQLLWAAQGITDLSGFRTAPSAGALYPLVVYVVIGNVEGVAKGIYKYMPQEHELVKIRDEDVRAELTRDALRQTWVNDGSIVIVFSAVYEQTTQKYGDRGIRYVQMEVGHAAQNVYLQAVSLNLGTAVIGAFKEDEVKKILNMSDKEHPLYVMPAGRIWK